jgi:uncharacterized protein (DUF427 family)
MAGKDAPAEFEWEVQDVEPPNTQILSAVHLGPMDLIEPNSIRFEFTGTDNGTVWFELEFECSLDGGPWEGCGGLPYYYFPIEDVNMEFLEPTDHHTHCPFKGDARYFSVVVGEQRAENAVWNYPEPLEGAPPIRDYLAFYFEKMDEWYEEDERIFVHPRDPYTRVDIRDSSRHVRVSFNGKVLAETERPKLLFETGLPTRYYIPPADVVKEQLVESPTTTQCPYKGTANYYSVAGAGKEGEDLVWYYRNPLKEAEDIAKYLAFYNHRVDLEVDGVKQ